MKFFRKLAEIPPTPGAAASPLPSVEISTTPAPGLRGPKGLAGPTNYSRVNSGAPPVPDAGASAQKSAPPMGAMMLPKMASEVSMGSISSTPSLQDMVKAAMAGAKNRADLADEAARQFSNLGEKTAGVSTSKDIDITTDYAEKYAAALEFSLPFLKEAAEFHLGVGGKTGGSPQRPGEGPGALAVSESKDGKSFPAHTGQALASHIPAVNSPFQKNGPGPATALQNDEARAPGGSEHQKVAQKNLRTMYSVLNKIAERPDHEEAEEKGIAQAKKGIEKAEKADDKEKKEEKKAFALSDAGHKLDAKDYRAMQHMHEEAAEGRRQYAKESPGMSVLTGEHVRGPSHQIAARHANYSAKEHEEGNNAWNPLGGILTKTDREKKGSANISLVDYMLSTVKEAEDAINPAHISAGAAVPPDTSAAGEDGGAPVGGKPKGPTELVGSNQAAINYDRAQARAGRAGEMATYITEPMKGSGHNATLQAAFEHASAKDGNKYASAEQTSLQTAAARALITKLAEEAGEKKTASAGKGQ